MRCFAVRFVKKKPNRSETESKLKGIHKRLVLTPMSVIPDGPGPPEGPGGPREP